MSRVSRPKYLHLPNVGVSSVLVHRHDAYLEKKSTECCFVALVIDGKERYGDPALRLMQVDGMNLRKIVVIRPSTQ